MSDNIKVVVKVRPLISREIEDKLSYQWRVKNNTLNQLDQNGKEHGQAFTFDKVYDEGTKTSDVYDDIAKPIVEAATAGFNGTIFAYGQTSSGKTYTMTGTGDSPGIIPLAVLNLFEIIKNAPDRDFLLRVSYLEIYNETVKDLLNPEKENIKIHESLQGIKVDVTEKVTASPEDVLEAMTEGEANRQKGATNMNEQSSRSHSIFQITIESREHVEGSEEGGCVNVSQLNLVDLAGSERAGQTGATGLRFKEGTHINKSLSALALVIKQLSEENKFTNYRDSKLTRILQNSLGGNAKTSIICAVTPAAVEETISTLQFANRAKAIKNKPEVNAVATDATMIQSLTKQMCKLQAQLESKKSIEQDNYKLQKQIASLQKLIINGFGQRRNLDLIGGSRRKVQQPRRITISAFHTTERDDEPVASIPKFCTPSLKYNPNIVPPPAEFLPVQSAGKLASVPEEPAGRLVTPPPADRRVCFNEEVIEIDSDDDSTQGDGEGPCSPYHTCQDASKTPPCVLRKNAKLAEKQMKDILLLTEREKIYKPSEIELIEKLEHSVSMKSKLEDEIDILKIQGQKKDLELEQLKNKIKKTEEEVNAITSANTELRTKCANYETKMTDWEVSVETLKRKAKLREDELLSLLEELKIKKTECIGKPLSRTIDKDIPFMDMSKDISLVNSDTESSIVNDEPPERMCDLVTDTQTQFSLKNQTIIELEAKLFSHKQKIATLENLSQELQDTICGYKEKLVNIDNENSVLRTTIDNLNSTINSQKENLDGARNDIESYNSVIQELQIKLTQKDTTPNINIDDSVLERMIANEEKFLANNENMKNIILSLRNVLDSRNKEISQLKLTLSNNSTDDKTLLEDVESKTKQIDTLNMEVDKLKKHVNENIVMINKLMHENNDLKVLEQELTAKLADVNENNVMLGKTNQENTMLIQNLTQENDKLSLDLVDKNNREIEIINSNKYLTTQINQLSNEIYNLKKDAHSKDDIISRLSQEEKESKENILVAKTAIRKLQTILSLLTGEIQEVPELIDNFVNIFSVFSENLNTLETIATDIIEQKQQAVNTNTSLKETVDKLLVTHKSEISELQNQIDELNKTKSNFGNENEMLNHQILQLKEELETINRELQIKLGENEKLKTNLNNNVCRTEELHQELMTIKDTMQVINGKEQDLKAYLQSKQSKFDEELRNKDDVISTLSVRLKDIEYKLKDTSFELEVTATKLHDVQKGRDEILANILKKASYLTDNCNIENKVSCDFEDADVNTYERILLTLDKIANHVTFIDMKNVDGEQENIREILSEAKKEIKQLTERNLTLTSDLFNLGGKNSELSFELEKIQSSHKNLNEHLESSQNILENVKKELKIKANELMTMEDKVKEWKDQFVTLDILMKQQMQELHLENDYLKSQCSNSDLRKASDVSSSDEIDISDVYTDNKIHQSYSNKTVEIITPPSLLTICCNKIVDSINLNSDCKTTPASSDTVIEVQNNDDQTSCICSQLLLELTNVREENGSLMVALEESEKMNRHLVKEQDEARLEIRLLLELQEELHKKLISHKTNLLILTATTYAENRSLESQVKGLQHHHNRFHNVCQRDIPDFKKQLRDLMLLLNGETSNTDAQNVSFKRYSLPDVLDSSTAVPNFRNESTLDGDLLMLDTNITLTTAADNTLLGPDQTCLDITQIFYNEACGQTNAMIQVLDQNIHTQMEILSHDNQTMFEKLQLMRDENLKLREQVDKYLAMKTSMIDAQSSPVKIPNLFNESITSSNTNDNIKTTNECSDCRNGKDSHSLVKIEDEMKLLSQELLDVKTQKSEIENKYNNLILETPSKDALVRKLNNLEKDHTNKVHEISKLNKTLDSKNKELKLLQEENDNLSTQVMDNISETDDLYKELESLKLKNSELIDKCTKLEQPKKELQNADMAASVICTECLSKDELIQSMRLKITKSKLNRSLSDSDTSSRYNKICTLQSQLHAGREDCKELTEDVATIKNHLERSNISMDLDESMGDTNVFTFAKDVAPSSPQSKKCIMPDIPEERQMDMYMMDKMECYHYYKDKTGIETGDFNCDLKIIEVMKMLYENLICKHGSAVEHLTNQLRDYGDARNEMQKQIDNSRQENYKFTKEIEERDKHYSSVASIISHIKNNIDVINRELINTPLEDRNTKIVNVYKENFLNLLDKEFGLSSVSIFEYLIENIVNKHDADLAGIMERYTKLQNNMENVTTELNSVNENLSHMKCQLFSKENDYNLLKAQKEKIHEISNAVTLDIVKREKELNDTMTKGYQRLLELNILTPDNVDTTLPLNMNIMLLFDQLIKQNESRVSAHAVKEKDLQRELNNIKSNLEDKESQLAKITTKSAMLQEINNSVTLELIEKDNQIQAIKKSHEELRIVCDSKTDENKNNIDQIEKMTEEVNTLKTKIRDKEKAIETLRGELDALKLNKGRDDTIIQLIEIMKAENENLKTINDAIIKERDTYAVELEKSGATIRQNKIDLDKLTSDIMLLRVSVKDNVELVENLKEEAKTLVKANVELKELLEAKCRECSRLETNIKTHETTAEIQTRIINKLKKQKIEEDRVAADKNKQFEEMSQKYDTLQNSIKNIKDENDGLRKTKESLEARISDLEVAIDNHKSRTSLDATADSSRRRRQSIHDSKRLFAEDKHDGGEHNHMESVFGSRPQPDDLFMDVDEDFSDRSTPIQLSKGRESLSVSRADQSDKDEEHSSRPSSVLATRRRRQSSHDLHRTVLRHTPSPHGILPGILTEELNNLETTENSTSLSDDSSLSALKCQLSSCRAELSELQERYRELDEECETCAEYLRERDGQCARLKREKTALQKTVTELEEKLQSNNPNVSLQAGTKRSVAHAAVNTDEDWANLHSVVVDRMSFDAEVEKNKKLSKTIEELRFKQQDLKHTLAKMQKALEKNTGNRELETTKLELAACKEELQELRERYRELDERVTERSTSLSDDSSLSALKCQLSSCRAELSELQERYRELDEECETCAEYLRERDGQCARLKREKTALQQTVTELTQKLQSNNPNVSLQAGTKRSVAHAAVNTDEDWANLHSVVVDRMSFDAEVEKNKKLSKTIEELRFKQQDLKHTLAKMQKALEKNTGNRELETTKLELAACKEELQELRERYRELDEECETCAQYLREKEEQCRKLIEAKKVLEVKLQEFQDDVSNITHTARKKRQTAHDQNRAAALDLTDATTETSDFLSYQVERDDSTRGMADKQTKDTKHLKVVVEKLSQQKAALEQQLASSKQASSPMFVATGSAIVQNQQITDVMKENQKLKKINARLINICKKRGKDSNIENEDPALLG